VKKLLCLSLAFGMIAAIGCSGSTTSSGKSSATTTTTTTTDTKAK
jgi:hypothetical protein